MEDSNLNLTQRTRTLKRTDLDFADFPGEFFEISTEVRTVAFNYPPGINKRDVRNGAVNNVISPGKEEWDNWWEQGDNSVIISAGINHLKQKYSDPHERF